MTTFWNWQSACRYLNRRIDALKPLPGSNIIIEKTASGNRISTSKNPVEGGGYQGFFKVTDASEFTAGSGVFTPVAAVADGRLAAAERMLYPAGLAVINDTLLECPPETVALPRGVSYLTADFHLSGDVPLFGGYSARSNGIAPGFESISIILAVAETGESSVRLCQQQYGMIYNYLFRSC
jgi:hypothetical protein